MTALLTLIDRMQGAASGAWELERDLALALGWVTRTVGGVKPWYAPDDPERMQAAPPRWTRSIDDAMTLLPSTAVNIDLFSHTRDGGIGCWSCRFMDTAQLMGERAAKQEIARLRKGHPVGRMLRGPPRIELEKAIAEHYREFYCRGAATAPLAITVASLWARQA